MRRNNPIFAVSPVVGVVIMVAITVVMGIVISGFFFNLTDRFTTSASANVDFQQDLANYDSGQYDVKATVDNMRNSEYLVIYSVNTSSEVQVETQYVGASNGNALRPGDADADYAPDSVDDSGSVDSSKGAILLRNGDIVVLKNLVAGDTVQVYGGKGGEESLVSDYTVRDVLP